MLPAHFSHRCGLTGEDLNRRWRDPNQRIHPEIFHTKGLLSYAKKVLEKDIFLFCDFHGHSRCVNTGGCCQELLRVCIATGCALCYY